MQPIGVFDSGYGGLTILKELEKKMPQYDYLYLGDNARAPYGNRSFETVYKYTLDAVKQLFDMNCELVILACNTASAKALRTIQQKDLPIIDPKKRVLGVIRPTCEVIGNYTKTRHIGILATNGTVSSNSYVIELSHLFPDITVHQEACPMWAPLVENGEYNSPGADYFLKKNIDNLLSLSPSIDTVVLACTHYPLLINKIRKHLPDHISLLSQGEVIANSLHDYLHRHPEMDKRCSKNSISTFYTSDSTSAFDFQAKNYYGKTTNSKHLDLLTL